MGSLLLNVIGALYLALGLAGVAAHSRSRFRDYAVEDLVRFSRTAKLAWAILFASAAALFGLSLLIEPELAPWLGWVTATAYLGSSLHEVWVDYGPGGHRVLRRGFFIMGAAHVAVAILVTFAELPST